MHGPNFPRLVCFGGPEADGRALRVVIYEHGDFEVEGIVFLVALHADDIFPIVHVIDDERHLRPLQEVACLVGAHGKWILLQLLLLLLLLLPFCCRKCMCIFREREEENDDFGLGWKAT